MSDFSAEQDSNSGSIAEPVIMADDVCLGYSNFEVLQSLNFRLEKLEVLAVVGASGSGKSALLEVIGLDSKSSAAQLNSGSLTVLGQKLESISKKQKNILTVQVAYLAQDAAVRLNPQLKVLENITEPITLRDKKWDKADLKVRALRVMKEFLIDPKLADRFPHELSSGQMQRVAIAKSFILDPVLWIADDPTRGIDASIKPLVVEAIRTRLHGISAVISSSDPLVLELASKVCLLGDSTVQAYENLPLDSSSDFPPVLAEFF